ncbi:hypothetical protein FG386_003395 [Cryptosporidium ryanae]|uniref:uncharacterized protein n=1 Tax=Cryptosporidium ryanae TaxID=515981 RepID=UPI00351AA454|nr:hypothetical protein FG386_003395 [Cryptosporidium ryanae]
MELSNSIGLSNKGVNVLLGYYAGNKISSDLMDLLMNSDLVCLHHNLNHLTLDSLSEHKLYKNKKFIEINKKKSNVWMIKPIIDKIINGFYYAINGLKKKENPAELCYLYSNNRFFLESNTTVSFNVADDYFLYLQRIQYFEFDVSNCYSGFRHLVLCSVDFTSKELKNQICCIKSLRYSIKEVIWKMFVMEVLFNWPIKITEKVEDIAYIDFSDQISFIINGNFSESNYISEFSTLFGHGELVPISQNPEVNFSSYILSFVTFSHDDILFFSSIFPPRKVVGPDFKDIEIPETILDPSSKFNFNRKDDEYNRINNKNTAKYTRFVLNNKFKLHNLSEGCTGNPQYSSCSIQILSI